MRQFRRSEDCINTFILKSDTENDLVFEFSRVLDCIPSDRPAENIRYQWSFIDDITTRCVTAASATEAVEFDPDVSRLWSVTNFLGQTHTTEATLNKLEESLAEGAIGIREEESYHAETGLFEAAFHVRRSGLGFSATTSDPPYYPPNNLVDMKGNLICDDSSPRPVFIKGSAGQLLLQLTVSWDDELLGRLSCSNMYRVIESRDPSLAHIDSYLDLSRIPWEIPPTTIEPAFLYDLTFTRYFRDRKAPAIAGVGDLNLNFEDESWRRDDLALPKIADDWFRSDELALQNDAPEEFPLGTTTVNWTVTDPNGNLTTVAQKITVEDREPPQFVIIVESPGDSSGGGGRPGGGGTGPDSGSPGGGARPEDYDLGIVELYQESDGHVSAENLVPPAAVDNYPGDIVVFLEEPEDTYALGESVVTWVARDIAGNETRADQLIRVTHLSGDVDLDGDVDDDDAASIEDGLGERALGYGEVALEDFNEDGRVDSADEDLRNEIQAQIDSTTMDLRDLNEDDWITYEDVTLIQRLMTREAHFSFDSDFSVLPLQTTPLGEAVLNQEKLELSSSQIGSLLITPASQVRKVTSLEMSFMFQHQLGARPPGKQGLSINLAPDIPNEAFGDDGAGSGLRISLDLGILIRDQQGIRPRTMEVW